MLDWVLGIGLLVVAGLYVYFVFTKASSKKRFLLEIIAWILIIVKYGSTTLDLLQPNTYFQFGLVVLFIGRIALALIKGK